jgi:flagellar hook-length control protein FliK
LNEQLVVQELFPFLKLGDQKIKIGGDAEKGEVNFLDLLLMELGGEKEESSPAVFLQGKDKSLLEVGAEICKGQEKQVKKSKTDDTLVKLEGFLPYISEKVAFLLPNISERGIQLNVGQVEEKLKSTLQNLIKNETHSLSEIARKISDFLRENFHIQLSPKDIEAQMRIAIDKSAKTATLRKLTDENFLLENEREFQGKVFKPKLFMKMNPITEGETKEEKVTENRFDLKHGFTLLENNDKYPEGLKSEFSHKANDHIDKLFQRIVDSVFAIKSKETSSVTVNLKPEALGKLQINLRSVDGNLVATIITESEKTKRQIESNLPLLHAQLDLKGIKIENVNVTVDRNFQFTYQYTGEGTHQRHSYGENQNPGYRHFASRGYLMTEGVEAFSQGVYSGDGHLDLRA